MRRRLVTLLLLGLYAGGCAGGGSAGESAGPPEPPPPTTTTAVARFDPARPETALVPVPGYQYRELSPTELDEARSGFDSDPAFKTVLKGFTARAIVRSRARVGDLTAMGFDPNIAASPSFRTGMEEGLKQDAVRTETTALAGEQVLLSENRDGTFASLWGRGPLVLIVAADERADLEHLTTALVAFNKTHVPA